MPEDRADIENFEQVELEITDVSDVVAQRNPSVGGSSGLSLSDMGRRTHRNLRCARGQVTRWCHGRDGRVRRAATPDSGTGVVLRRLALWDR